MAFTRTAGVAACLAAAALGWLASSQPSIASHAPPGPRAWGYEARFGFASMFAYDLARHQQSAPDCWPRWTENGRGVEYDPADGNLWYTRLNYWWDGDFRGDGRIHKTTPPPRCTDVKTIPFGDGPGTPLQDAVGALDLAPDGNLWAAGFQPVGGQAHLYKVDRDTGAVLRSCHVPFQGHEGGNDTLAFARIPGLGGSGSYLLTDAGLAQTDPPELLVLDEPSCDGGEPATVVRRFAKVVPMTGIEYVGGKLIASTQQQIVDLGAPPFAAVNGSMSSGVLFLEDITVEPFNSPPDCSSGAARPASLWPPDHALADVTVSGATDPDGDPVQIAVLGATQDEPSLDGGDRTAPDARAGPSPDRVELRAERSPRGDGRVYRLEFEASDPAGASCRGEASVTVRRQPGVEAVDSSPPSYDSFEQGRQ